MTELDVQCAPHIASATTTGTISLATIWNWDQDAGHCNLNHDRLVANAPQPHDPEASDVIVQAGSDCHSIDLPYHLGRKDTHQCKTE